MKVYCNPYCHLDHKGRLAGACPYDPKHAGGARLHVSAELRLLNPEEIEELKRQKASEEDRARAEHYGFIFSADPLSIPEQVARYYQEHARSGCVFAPRDNKPPMEAWRKARAAVIADWKNRYGTEPDTSGWAEQFPLDKDLAAVPTKVPGGEK